MEFIKLVFLLEKIIKNSHFTSKKFSDKVLLVRTNIIRKREENDII